MGTTIKTKLQDAPYLSANPDMVVHNKESPYFIQPPSNSLVKQGHYFNDPTLAFVEGDSHI